MSTGAAGRAEGDSTATTIGVGAVHSQEAGQDTSQDTLSAVEQARQADYIAFLFRAPYALDAHEMGFVTGLREDYGPQDDPYDSLDLPIQMLDNDFRNPDLQRYVRRCEEYQPQIGVVGDAYSSEEAHEYVGAAQALQEEFDDFEPIIVPKSLGALEAIPREIVVGYPIGYSEIKAPDFSDPEDWEDRRIHVLGGTPPKQWEAIQQLTNSGDHGGNLNSFGLDPEPIANIVGLDWNGLHKVALLGEYWHHEKPHWRRADELTIRATVRKGLEHVRQFWRERGVWPESRPATDHEVRSEPPAPPEAICHGCGHDLARGGSIGNRDAPLVEEYEDGTVLQFCSERCRGRSEHLDGVIPLSHGDRRGGRLGSHYRERERAEWFDRQ